MSLLWSNQYENHEWSDTQWRQWYASIVRRNRRRRLVYRGLRLVRRLLS